MKTRALTMVLCVCVLSACAGTTQDTETEPTGESAMFALGSEELTYLLFGLAVLVTAVQ